MGEAKVSEELIKHAVSSLATAHPLASAQRAIRAMKEALTVDTKDRQIAGAGA